MIKTGIALLAAALLSACAGMPAAPPPEEEATAAAGYGRAFGRVQYLDKGQEVAWRASLFNHDTLTLFLRPAAGGRLQYLQLEDDGSFQWPLVAGEYLLLGFQFQRSGAVVTRLTGRVMTSFSISKAGLAAYVGDLEISAERTGYRFRVIDRYEDAVSKAQERQSTLEPTKALMRPEPATGKYERVVSICNTVAWQVDCQGRYQGVQPLQPAQTDDGYPLTESLIPLLEWKPVGRPNTTYDVAIYESLNITTMASSAGRLRGPLVAYGEGLREPRYTPPMPLEPEKQYEWTVRLRDKDTVSSWSTTSQTIFLLVAGSRRSGRMFGFTTPSK